MTQRVIKFRRALFLDEDRKEFLRFTPWGVNLGECSFLNPATNGAANSFVDQQFTGLKDKNGVEVYHGDILKMYRHSDETHRHEPSTIWTENGRIPEIREVKFSCGTFYLDSQYGQQRTFMSLARPGESFEIIGNVYENPELLT